MSFSPFAAKRLIYNAFLLLLAGCAALGPPPADGGFVLRGKMGVVDGEESFSARFLWQQHGADYVIDLWGPLGQGRMQLTGSDRTLEFRDGDGSLLSRGAPDAVMERHLGWSLPLDVLPQWVRGRPAARLPVSAPARDDAGRWSSFDQLGWRVELDRYQPVAGAAQGEAQAVERYLPHRVTARRDSYRVRLAISQWRF